MALQISWPKAAPILAIPGFYLLLTAPHAYAMNLIQSTDARLHDNANPHGSAGHADIKKALGPAMYARWERARAAHRNGHESFPLFAASMLAGSLTGVEGLWIVATAGLGLRAVYNVLYIRTTSQRASLWRTVVWNVQAVTALGTLIRAALKA